MNKSHTHLIKSKVSSYYIIESVILYFLIQRRVKEYFTASSRPNRITVVISLYDLNN